MLADIDEASYGSLESESIHQQLQQDLERWNSLARQRLAASRAARQRAEADVQLLANRLRLLRQEEAKSRKIIEEVRKRTQEVLETRMNQQQMLQDQSSVKQSNQQAIEQKRQQNNWRRVQARFARQQAKEERVCANRRCVSEQRAFLQQRALAERNERPPSVACSTAASDDTVVSTSAPKAPPRRPPAAPTSAELLAEERELLARLRRSDASARVRRPALPPVALEDEGPIKAALREASFNTPRRS